jgi:hypothetical protein
MSNGAWSSGVGSSGLLPARLSSLACREARGWKSAAAAAASALLAVAVLATGALATDALAAGETAKPGAEPPKHLDRKGFFVLAPDRARELRVKSISTSDWRYATGGALEPVPGGAIAEYDESGRLVRFSGQIDQGPNAEVEYRYDSAGRLIEEQAYAKTASGREPIVRFVFDLSQPGRKQQSVYNAGGTLVAKVRFWLDRDGRITRFEQQDAVSGKSGAYGRRDYDAAGNFIEERDYAGRTTYALDKGVLTVTDYAGPSVLMYKGKLQRIEQYTFDGQGDLLSFYRQSGDGSFWDRFTYKLDERGLPLESTWSRLEYVKQDPYALTRYTYTFHP